MKVLLSWLNEFAPIDGDPTVIGDQLSDLGMAVESIEYLGQGLDGIVVARVLSLRPHPQADRIQLVDVDLGDGEALQVCCGAFNMAVGDLIPLATLGTTMPGGMKIERRKLRGEWSNGMLCSSRELGLGDDHEGILVLNTEVGLGEDLRTALGIQSDVLYDLEINPNRPDAMSVAGIARDLAARLSVPFTQKDPMPAVGATSMAGRASVEILAPELCGRLFARVFDDVTMSASPQWLVNRLRSMGMRSVNRVVDVSNYVMLELGQPNHTYDLDRLVSHHLGVRWAREGERIMTLDGVERVLSSADGVLADGNDAAVGIAGVMGGASTEITDQTTSVLLEMAWWDPMTIARSSKRLNLRSEASARFERGTDPEILELATLRFAELLADSAALAEGSINVEGNRPAASVVRVRTGRVNHIVGIELSPDAIVSLLEPIGFGVEPIANSSDFDVTVPSFRPDTETEIDVVEEVARHFGYANIPRTIPPSVRAGSLSAHQLDRRVTRQVMVGLGLNEAMPLPFLAPGDLIAAGLDGDAITLSNPLAAEESVLRTSMIPGLLKSLSYNASHRLDGVGLFEIGKVFRVPAAGEQQPDERELLTVLAAGRGAPDAVEWWHVLADALGFVDAGIDQRPIAGMHPGRSGVLRVGNDMIGSVGEIDPRVLSKFALSESVAVVEVDLEHLLSLPHGLQAYVSVSRYPSSDIDLAFVVNDDIPASAVRETIRRSAGELLVSLSLFDVFRSDALPSGTRSLAFALRLQAPDRTLTEQDVATVHAAVIASVESTHDASLRA
ncbi:MAG: phenylalanine--tRNA ligase subunit beta [Actinomycetes bacterium]